MLSHQTTGQKLRSWAGKAWDFGLAVSVSGIFLLLLFLGLGFPCFLVSWFVGVEGVEGVEGLWSSLYVHGGVDLVIGGRVDVMDGYISLDPVFPPIPHPHTHTHARLLQHFRFSFFMRGRNKSFKRNTSKTQCALQPSTASTMAQPYIPYTA